MLRMSQSTRSPHCSQLSLDPVTSHYYSCFQVNTFVLEDYHFIPKEAEVLEYEVPENHWITSPKAVFMFRLHWFVLIQVTICSWSPSTCPSKDLETLMPCAPKIEPVCSEPRFSGVLSISRFNDKQTLLHHLLLSFIELSFNILKSFWSTVNLLGFLSVFCLFIFYLEQPCFQLVPGNLCINHSCSFLPCLLLLGTGLVTFLLYCT